jgi:hypothetical protein
MMASCEFGGYVVNEFEAALKSAGGKRALGLVGLNDDSAEHILKSRACFFPFFQRGFGSLSRLFIHKLFTDVGNE